MILFKIPTKTVHVPPSAAAVLLGTLMAFVLLPAVPAIAEQPTRPDAQSMTLQAQPTQSLHSGLGGELPTQAALIQQRPLDLAELDAKAFGDWDATPSPRPASARRR